MLEGITPLINLKHYWSERRGRLLVATADILKNNDQHYSSFVIKAWNELPRHVRDIKNVSVDTFKSHLDKFLNLLEDHPHLPYEKYRWCRNDLISVLRYQKEENRRFLGRVPLST